MSQRESKPEEQEEQFYSITSDSNLGHFEDFNEKNAGSSGVETLSMSRKTTNIQLTHPSTQPELKKRSTINGIAAKPSISTKQGETERQSEKNGYNVTVSKPVSIAEEPKQRQQQKQGGHKKVTELKHKIPTPDEQFERLENEKDQPKPKKIKKAVQQKIQQTLMILENEEDLDEFPDISDLNQRERYESTPQFLQPRFSTSDQNPNFSGQSNNAIPLSKSYDDVRLTKKPQANKFTIFEVLIANCMAKLHNDDEYKKYKYELNDNNLIINNRFLLPLGHIIKIRVISRKNEMSELAITFEKQVSEKKRKKSWWKSEESSKQSSAFGEKAMEERPASSNKNAEKIVEDFLYLMETNEVIYSLFSSIIVRKLSLKGIKIEDPEIITSFKMTKEPFKYTIEGMVYKKSKHLKKWKPRFIKIHDHTLESYQVELADLPKVERADSKVDKIKHEGKKAFEFSKKKAKNLKIAISEKYSFIIPAANQLSTKFQIYEYAHLVVRISEKKSKTEIAIPITNYANVITKNNWLYGLTSILYPSK